MERKLSSEVLLKVDGLSASYGSVQALDNISFQVRQGEIVTIIGSNGAGKTTLLRCISRLMSYTGSVMYEGNEISKWGPDQIVRSGIVQVPEGRQIFPEMSVMENLKMGAFTRKRSDNIQVELDFVFNLFPRVKERLRQKGGSLSGGEQQMLAISRALMAKPKLLLLDEPSMGIAPVLVDEIFNTIQELNQKDGITILLIEQNAKLALEFSHYAFVIEAGNLMLSGESSDIAENEEVKRLYLGG
jgi:branched-chain amino acid transport system ATP-binding protein